MSKSCATSLAIINSYGMQPNALERSVNNAVKTPPLSIASKQCCAL